MADALTPEELSHQLRRQARWTRQHRLELYRRVNLRTRRKVLDVACGDGIITAEIAAKCLGKVIGVDKSPDMVELARRNFPDVDFRVEDMHALPFRSGSFDLVVCNFGLLWAQSPEMAVQEMARILKRGGVLLDTAEPDYSGRIDYPDELSELGKLISEAMLKESANPDVGRSLKALFASAGLEVEVGILPSLWNDDTLSREFEEEWRYLERVLSLVMPLEQIRHLKALDARAVRDGTRLSFTPIFWAIGRKP